MVPGPGRGVLEVSRAGLRARVSILHFLGGFTVDVTGDRAIAQTKMTITSARASTASSSTSSAPGRFYDFFEERAGAGRSCAASRSTRRTGWTRSTPAATLALDPALLAHFPDGYRHLGYLQTKAGFNVKRGLPGLSGRAVEHLYAEGRAWLDGSPRPGVPL